MNRLTRVLITALIIIAATATTLAICALFCTYIDGLHIDKEKLAAQANNKPSKDIVTVYSIATAPLAQTSQCIDNALYQLWEDDEFILHVEIDHARVFINYDGTQYEVEMVDWDIEKDEDIRTYRTLTDLQSVKIVVRKFFANTINQID